ncbi:hypothetical protein F5Y17DRAFT_228456 [Xylariaceae sp. FL0594]|nr:hypothetical protein F5Y17DRAFT_228456 [Xylariaceae sp. FL0594]
MVDFLELIPAEIAENIWTRLLQSDLNSAMRVSRAWARWTCPLLYSRTIDLDFERQWLMLIRTVLSHPDLALLIRNLCFYRTFDVPEGEEPIPIQLLRFLPRIRTLDSWTKIDLAVLFKLHTISDHELNHPVGFSLDHLTTFWAGGEPQNAAKVARLWALPAMRNLRVYIFLPYNPACRLHNLSGWPVSYTLRYLLLKAALRDGSWLSHILECSPNLEVVSLGFFPGTLPTAYDFSTWWQGLSRISSSLRQLQIAAALLIPEERDSSEVVQIKGPLSTFQGFPRLHTLEVPIVMLLGWDPRQAPQLVDVLPPFLQTLKLTAVFRDELLNTEFTRVDPSLWAWDNAAVGAQLKTLFTGINHTQSTLRSVGYNNLYGEEWDVEDIQLLTHLAREAGIDFEVYNDDNLCYF